MNRAPSSHSDSSHITAMHEAIRPKFSDSGKIGWALLWLLGIPLPLLLVLFLIMG